MRLDKYLQVTRLVKKREHTRELCEAGRLELNGRPAKPSRTVGPGDILSIHFWRRRLTVRVGELPVGSVPRKEAHLYYEVVGDEPVDADTLPPWE